MRSKRKAGRNRGRVGRQYRNRWSKPFVPRQEQKVPKADGRVIRLTVTEDPESVFLYARIAAMGAGAPVSIVDAATGYWIMDVAERGCVCRPTERSPSLEPHFQPIEEDDR